MKIPRSPIFFFGATLVAFSAALMVFIGLVLLSQRSVQSSTEWVDHTLEVQQRLGKLETDLVAAEAGQVAVLLTGDQSHLTSYYRATTDIGLTLRSLSFLVADNPVQSQRIVQLKALFREKIREMDGTVQTVRIGDQGGALAAARRNAAQASTTAPIQEVLEAAARTEAMLHQERGAKLQRSAARRDTVALGMILTLALLMVGLFVAVKRARSYERLIKVCAWSKTVEHEGEWISYDEYLRRRFNVSVSHGISPEAMEKLEEQD
ncbi:MAG: CHASE3 domain-containing protein [Gemmatimonadaceae bacterium]|nr:CHASE3 domain-containing protein [Gemmatimonadaceae bacterium]